MELRDYLRILRAHWPGILVLTLVGGAVAFGRSTLQPKVYTASAGGHRPVIETIFDLPPGAGLTDVFAGRASLDDGAHRPDPSGHLVVLTATVIVDSPPPAIPVTGAAVLGTSADGVLLIVSAGRTTYEMMQKAVENIGKANGRVFGVVLNKVPQRGAGGSAYGYQYRGSYAAASPAGRTT